MRLEFLGGARTVTGSSYLLQVGDEKYLVDCGMFQGARRIRELNQEPFNFNPTEIAGVFLTHAHIDHAGRIPQLVHEGFRGKIYTTPATKDLANILLPDSAYIQKADAEIFNRKNIRRDIPPIEPLYDIDDVTTTLGLITDIPYEEEFAVGSHIRAKFYDAGHILGSAIIEMFIVDGGKETRLVFSGDLGQPNQPILKDPTILDGADFVLVESTYGNRIHHDYDKETALLEVINDTMDRGGNLIIPSFAVGRTQTLLYYLYKLWQAGRLDGDIPIVIDSPLAIQATAIFLKNYEYYDEEAIDLLGENGVMPIFPQLRLSRTSEDSRALNSAEGSAIIISASGMADAGRVLHHLKHNLWRPESTVLFVGFQAEGSLGRRLVDGISKVRVLGEEVAVRAKIEVLDGFSAHADANQIISWLSHMKNNKPAKVFIVHGETPAQEALKERIQDELGLEGYIPFRGDAVTIAGRAATVIPSNIPAVSVEMEMEDVLREFDEEYRQLRKRIIAVVVRQPRLMQPIIRTLNKAKNYFKKLATPFQL